MFHYCGMLWSSKHFVLCSLFDLLSLMSGTISIDSLVLREFSSIFFATVDAGLRWDTVLSSRLKVSAK